MSCKRIRQLWLIATLTALPAAAFQSSGHEISICDRWQTSALQIRGGDTSADIEATEPGGSAPVDECIDVNLVSSVEKNIASDGSSSDVHMNTVGAELSEQSPHEKTPSPSEDALAVDGSTEISEETTSILIELRASVAEKRAKGKSLHDSGELPSASKAFHEAASLLQRALQSSDLEEGVNDEITQMLVEEFATCRLHEALCLFKNGQAELCAQVCSDVLGDGIVVKAAEPEENNVHVHANVAGNGETELEDNLLGKTREHTIENNEAREETDYCEAQTEDESRDFETGSKLQEQFISLAGNNMQISSHVRARAHLRRSKARLALGDLDGAIEDAKQSAFMGDRNAVTFYGRLLREGMAANEPVTNALYSPSPWGTGDVQNSLLEGMMGLSPNTDSSSSLLSSLLTGNSGNSNGMGLLVDLLNSPTQTDGKFQRRKKKKSGIDSLAKSVLANLMKRMEDKETQITICKYLHSTNTQQIMSMATMAGIPMKEDSAAKLVSIANGITPKGIRRGIRNVKRGLKVVKTVRKILKVIEKYKTVLVLVMMFCWIRSAILEPFPVDKRRTKMLTN